MPDYIEVRPLFPTLRAAGYTRCEHPRGGAGFCHDCGAKYVNGVWMGGHLEFKREPWRMERGGDPTIYA